MADDVRARLLGALERSTGESSDFDLNKDVVLPPGRKLRDAAVLVGVRPSGRGGELLLTKRSSALKHHPGQISFPGGKVDEGDDGLVGAALREAEEETGLPRRQVDVLGTLPAHETVTGFSVTPVLAMIDGDFEERAEIGEVAEIFWVPLAHVADAARYSVQSRRWRGQKRHYYTVAFGPYYIWGATARMLRGLSERLT